ncbi:MAG: hypothetical protein ACRC0Y_07890 [Fusobacteriaceae bacterium]
MKELKMNITTQKKHISSLELIEQINIFRDEFEDEIAEGIEEKIHYIKIIEDCYKKKFLIQSKEEILMSEIPEVVKAAALIDCYDEEYVASKNWNTKDLRDCLCKDKVLNKIKDGVYEIGENFEALFLNPILGNYKKSKTNNIFIPVFYRSSLEYFKSKTFIYALNQHLRNKKECSSYESGEIINYEDNWE